MVRVFKAHRQAHASLYSFTLPEPGDGGKGQFKDRGGCNGADAAAAATLIIHV